MKRDFLTYGFRCSIGSLFLLVSASVLHAERPPVASITSSGSNPPLVEIVSPGQFLLEHLVNPWCRRLDALQSSSISLARQPQVTRSYGPLRQITFLGGDRICAEIVGGDDETIEFRLRGGQTMAVQRNAISMIRVPPGEIDVLNESFESSAAPRKVVDTSGPHHIPAEDPRLDATLSASGKSSLRLHADSKPLVVDLPNLSEARVQFWFRVDPAVGPAKSDGDGAQVQFVFQAQSSSRWQVDLTHSTATGRAQGSTNFATRPARIGPGWHCLIVIIGPDRSMCLVDDSLLWSAGDTPGLLQSLQISSTTDCWIDSLLVSKRTNDLNQGIVRPSSQDDAIAGTDRIQWFGHVKQISETGIVLNASGRDRLLRWNQVTALSFRQPDQPVREMIAVPPGLVAEIEFQSLVDRPAMPFDKVTATIIESNQEFVVAAHPWLGTMAIEWSSIATIRPRYYGRLYLLDGRQLHLGDAIEQDFDRPMPDGIDWSSEVDLPTDTAHFNDFWLVIDVAELEPASLDAPPANRFLNELRAGQLVTELTVNDQPSGNLNQWLRFRSQIDHPEQLRIPLSSGLMHSGYNTFRLKQVPLRKTGHYDNCEVSNLRLEVIERRSASQR